MDKKLIIEKGGYRPTVPGPVEPPTSIRTTKQERIKELAGQAYVQACLELQQTDIAHWYSDRGPPSELVNQKFAELIVQECVNIVNAMDSIRNETFHRKDGSKVETGDVLKQHFGIPT